MLLPRGLGKLTREEEEDEGNHGSDQILMQLLEPTFQKQPLKSNFLPSNKLLQAHEA